MFSPPKLPLVVYTDLDATLLDHDTYSYEAALPSIQKLMSLDIPIIPVSSKTLPEIQTLAEKIGLNSPIIAENGSAIATPRDYFVNSSTTENRDDMNIQLTGKKYSTIVSCLNQIRTKHAFEFVGFSDLTDQEVADLTGLNLDDASQARQREGSEPILWQGDEVSFKLFKKELAIQSLTLTKGGRFYHVMGNCSKGLAVQKLNALFLKHNFLNFQTIALGDSENDVSMLKVVDIPVLVKRKDGAHLQEHEIKNITYTEEVGPAGWNKFILAYVSSAASNLS